jgi:effector-binding domain-containing protein
VLRTLTKEDQMGRFHEAVVVCLAIGLACAACGEKPEPAKNKETAAKAEPKKPTAVDLLDAAIAAHGGFDKLKTAGSWKSTSKGTYMGMPYESVNLNRDGVVRMDIVMGDGEKMSMVMGVDPCWMTSGPVVIECTKDERAANRVMVAMSRSMMLAPLKEPGWTVALADAVEVDGRKCDALAVENAKSGAKGTLAFDPETRLLARAEYTAVMMGQPTRFVSWPSDYRELCGVRMAGRWKMTMNDQPYVEEEILELACGPVEEAALAPPAQVADGTIVERVIRPLTGACMVMKGPYEGTGEAMGRLMGFLGQKQLMPVGAPMLTYLEAPPAVKDPQKYETEICFPVGAPPPPEPQVEGDFTIKAFGETRVLAAFGLGPCAETSPRLAGLLGAEMGKRKLAGAGPMRQVTYSDPASVPPEKLVSEMQIPLAGE